ncbi:MAG: T9SS type A sorting domain-containing protein [Sphingomonadales bacterium]|nr:T9SS type A sorting domain-containing protein [Sphingomonadales bacterium]
MKKFILVLSILFASRAFAQTPNWSEHVAPILYKNCTNCHIEGGIAPFSLVGYEKAVAYAGGIKNATASRSMPPWPADLQYQRYAHERVLSNEEIGAIAAWVDGGTPKGDTTKAPAKPVLKKGGSITNPTRNLKMPDYSVKTTTDEYRCFVLPTGFTKDQFLTAIEVIPGNLRVVHHALIFHDTTAKPSQLDAADPKPGYLSFGGTGSSSSDLIGIWVPGSEPYFFPTGFGIKLPKNGNIVLQIHYPGGVNNVVDSTRVILKTTTIPQRPVAIQPALNHNAPNLQNGPLYIPANQVKSFNNKYDLPVDVSVFTVGPHMHLIGSSIKAFGVTTNKDTIRFVDIPKWDFHWQRSYTFRNVLKVPGGTSLRGQASYNNTSSNPFNPSNPPQAVSLGEGTNDEMFLVYFWYTLYQPGDENIVIDNAGLKNVSKTSVLKTETTRIYPNPSSDFAWVSDVRFAEGPLQWSITDMTGKMIQHGSDVLQSGKHCKINVSELTTGAYQISIQQGNTNYSGRLLKQ